MNLTISQFLGSFPPQSNKTSFVLDLNHSPPFFSRSASCSLMQSRQHFLAAAAHTVKSMLFSTSGIKNTTLPNTRYLPTSKNTTECYTPLRVMTGWSHPRQGVTAFGDWCSAAEARSLSLPCSWRLAAGHAKGKSALSAKPAQPALFQSRVEKALLCSAFLLSVKV